MMTVYLNSLYSMLVENNPLHMTWQQLYRNVRALWNLKGNMAYMGQKHSHMVHQYQAIEAYVESSRQYSRSRFDVTR